MTSRDDHDMVIDSDAAPSRRSGASAATQASSCTHPAGRRLRVTVTVTWKPVNDAGRGKPDSPGAASVSKVTVEPVTSCVAFKPGEFEFCENQLPG